MALLVRKYLACLCTVFMLSFVAGYHIDNKCSPKFFPNRSSVCVCNSTYCDTVTREEPEHGRYFAYASSEGGLRFRRTTYYLQPYRHYSDCLVTMDIDATSMYQTVEGFGGAITDSAAINWHSLQDPHLKNNLINSYCGDAGLQYNMLRVPIGGTDFSTHPYAYNELPVNDTKLTNFTLAPEDLLYKIPMIKACQEAASANLDIIATTWSPPSWMKDSGHLIGYSRLKKEYYQTFADYHAKFIEEYGKQGIPIWGITTTNEPLNGLMSLVRYNSLGWSVKGMAEWIKTNLGPTMRKLFPGLKIIGVDDQRFTVPLWFNILVSEYPEALEFIDGVAVHYYFDKVTPPSLLKKALEQYPRQFIIATEASEGGDSMTRVDLGSWTRAENYAIDILEDLNNDVTGWIDFNMCLNTEGGPSWVRSFVDSAIIVNAEKGEFYKQPMFYIMGHFAKFVPRGSRRIKVTERFNCGDEILNVAFLTPKNTIVLIVYNKGLARAISIKLRGAQALIPVEAKSIITIEFPNEDLQDNQSRDTGYADARRPLREDGAPVSSATRTPDRNSRSRLETPESGLPRRLAYKQNV